MFSSFCTVYHAIGKLKGKVQTRIIIFINKIKIKKFYKTTPKNVINEHLLSQSDFWVLIVAFNKPELIKIQIQTLQHLKFNNTPIIVDNSSDSNAALQIKQLCLQNNLTYIQPRVVKNLLSGMSHGSCINWFIKHFVSQYSVHYLFTLDHDCFAYSDVYYSDLVKNQKIYGRYQEREGWFWYLWPGFSVFDLTEFDCMKLDFCPLLPIGDTGAANYEYVYKNIDKRSLLFPSEVHHSITGDPISSASPEELFETYDDKWVHVRAASEIDAREIVKKRFSYIKQHVV